VNIVFGIEQMLLSITVIFFKGLNVSLQYMIVFLLLSKESVFKLGPVN